MLQEYGILQQKVYKNGHFDGADVFIKLDDLAFAAGQQITGVILVDQRRVFEASSLQLNLKGFEYTRYQVNPYDQRGLMDSNNTEMVVDTKFTIAEMPNGKVEPGQ